MRNVKKPNVFTAKSNDEVLQSKHNYFNDARIKAQDYCRRSNGMKSTVTDSHGCRWDVWGGGRAELQYCPAVEAGRGPCDCEVVNA